MKSFKKVLLPLAVVCAAGCFGLAGCGDKGSEKPKEPVVESVTDKEFADWGIYTGTLTDGIPTGAGKLVTEGYTYEGTFEDGFKVTGVGIKTQGNETFKGSFVNGVLDGYGEVDYGNGCHGIGEWKEGRLHGTSFFTWQQPSGGYDIYFGEWSGQVRVDDDGYYQFNNGCWYQGEFNNDWINGKGVFHWVGGNYFDGEFAGGSPVKGSVGYGQMDGVQGYIKVDEETGGWSWYTGSLEGVGEIVNGQPVTAE
jgi:hypothetical protein